MIQVNLEGPYRIRPDYAREHGRDQNDFEYYLSFHNPEDRLYQSLHIGTERKLSEVLVEIVTALKRVQNV